MSEYKLKTGKIEEKIVGAYKSIEDAVVGTYKKIEDKFVDTFLEEVSDDAPQGHTTSVQPTGADPLTNAFDSVDRTLEFSRQMAKKHSLYK